MAYFASIVEFINEILSSQDQEYLAQETANMINSILGTQHDEDDVLYVVYNEIAETTVCSECGSHYYLSTTQTPECVRCSLPGCKSCNQDGTCAECKPGFWDDSGSCSACDDTCKTCNGAGSTSCDSCQLPLSLTSANTCIQCDEKCRTCNPNDPSLCATCKTPYNLEADQNGECYRCSQDLCIDCEANDKTVCNQCKQGFFLLDGICTSCLDKCSQCSSEGTCDRCKDGYVLAEDGSC